MCGPAKGPGVLDETTLDAEQDWICLPTMMKARPAEEGGERIIYVEASREERDQQDEVVLAKALRDSTSHFLKFGNVDLDHKSMPAVAAKYGIAVPDEWAIGQPVDVRFSGGATMVKAQLYRGDTPLATRANLVWDGLTKLNPPARYYASVGGAVLGREARTDPLTKSRAQVITRVRWNNLALSATPVNQHLSPASTAPIGVFAKSLGGWVLKTLEAGGGTDSAALTGGAALRTQSLDRKLQSYWQFRERLAADIRAGRAAPTNTAALSAHAQSYGLEPDEAAEWTVRFLRDLRAGRDAQRKRAH